MINRDITTRETLTTLYEAYADDLIEKVYDAYLNNELKRLPACYRNKESYLRIIKYLYDSGNITKDNLTSRLLLNDYKLKYLNQYLVMDDAYQFLFGEKFYLKVWEYPKYKFRKNKLTYEVANEIINEYLHEYRVKIENVFDFDYYGLIKKCGLTNLANEDLLYFVVQYNKFKYPSYMYKIKSVNYYKTDSNLLFDLKYLIEKDMELQLEKIPLYLTRNNLHKSCSPLYNYIITNKNKSIFEWVNILYPNEFIEADFEINAYRNEFDSDTEMYIHELLEKEFPKQVMYNQRNNREVRLKGKVPDWFIFTDQGVWIVEYFGMLEDRETDNSRLKHYRDRYEDKINTYEELNGYKFLYLYREDIVDDFKGYREKIEKVKEYIDVARV